jgi:membrane protein required for colicin V production
LNYGAINSVAKVCFFFIITNRPLKHNGHKTHGTRIREETRASCVVSRFGSILKIKLSLILLNINIMNWLDAVIVVVLILSLVTGFINGLVKEVASLAALILGIWGAIKFSSFTAGKLYDYFDMTGRYVGIIAFLITFALIVVLIHFIGILADKVVNAASLGFINRILGIVFGLLKSVLIMSVFFVVLNALDARRSFLPKKTIEESKFFNPISDIAPAIFPIIGEGGFNRSFDRFKKKPQEPVI